MAKRVHSSSKTSLTNPAESLTTIARRAITGIHVEPAYTQYAYVPQLDGEPDIYDGDTVRLQIDMGQRVWIRDLQYRLYGINTPELRTVATREAGEAARNYLQSLIKSFQLQLEPPADGGYWLVVKTHKHKRRRAYRAQAQQGKYGRYLVELFGKDMGGQWVNLNRKLLQANHAEVYLG